MQATSHITFGISTAPNVAALYRRQGWRVERSGAADGPQVGFISASVTSWKTTDGAVTWAEMPYPSGQFAWKRHEPSGKEDRPFGGGNGKRLAHVAPLSRTHAPARVTA